RVNFGKGIDIDQGNPKIVKAIAGTQILCIKIFTAFLCEIEYSSSQICSIYDNQSNRNDKRNSNELLTKSSKSFNCVNQPLPNGIRYERNPCNVTFTYYLSLFQLP
ncbi:unnamed protein product, partial [Rotaria socialis]